MSGPQSPEPDIREIRVRGASGFHSRYGVPRLKPTIQTASSMISMQLQREHPGRRRVEEGGSLGRGHDQCACRMVPGRLRATLAPDTHKLSVAGNWTIAMTGV